MIKEREEASQRLADLLSQAVQVNRRLANAIEEGPAAKDLTEQALSLLANYLDEVRAAEPLLGVPSASNRFLPIERHVTALQSHASLSFRRFRTRADMLVNLSQKATDAFDEAPQERGRALQQLFSVIQHLNSEMPNGWKAICEQRAATRLHPVARKYQDEHTLSQLNRFSYVAATAANLADRLLVSTAPTRNALLSAQMQRALERTQALVRNPCVQALTMRNEIVKHWEAHGVDAVFPDAEVAASVLDDGAGRFIDYASMLQAVAASLAETAPTRARTHAPEIDIVDFAAKSFEQFANACDLVAQELRESADARSARRGESAWIRCRLQDGSLAAGHAPSEQAPARLLVPAPERDAPSHFELDLASGEYLEVPPASDEPDPDLAAASAASRRVETYRSLAERAERRLERARALAAECQDVLGQSSRWSHSSIVSFARVRRIAARDDLEAMEKIAARLPQVEQASEPEAAGLAQALRESAAILRASLARLESDDVRYKCFKDYERPVAAQWHALLRAGQIESVRRSELPTDPPGRLIAFTLQPRPDAPGAAAAPAAVVHVHLNEPLPPEGAGGLDWNNVAAAHVKRADQAHLGARWQSAERARGHGESATIHRSAISREFLADLVAAARA